MTKRSSASNSNSGRRAAGAVSAAVSVAGLTLGGSQPAHALSHVDSPAQTGLRDVELFGVSVTALGFSHSGCRAQ